MNGLLFLFGELEESSFSDISESVSPKGLFEDFLFLGGELELLKGLLFSFSSGILSSGMLLLLFWLLSNSSSNDSFRVSLRFRI